MDTHIVAMWRSIAFIYVQQQAHSFTTSPGSACVTKCKYFTLFQKWFLIRAQLPLGLNTEYDLFVKGLRLAQRLISLGSLIHRSRFLLSSLLSASFGDSPVFVIMLHRNTETEENRPWITKKNIREMLFSLLQVKVSPHLLSLNHVMGSSVSLLSPCDHGYY